MKIIKILLTSLMLSFQCNAVDYLTHSIELGGYLGDANIAQWSTTVRRVKGKFPNLRTVIPGHGKVGDRSLLDYTIQLFNE